MTKTKPDSQTRLVVISVLIAGIIGAWLISAVVGMDGQPDSENGSGSDRRYAAQAVCENFVKQRLKSPGTAKFSGVTATGSGQSWIVRGAVDSENSFGALLRMNYSCAVEHVSGDNWRLVAITGLD